MRADRLRRLFGGIERAKRRQRIRDDGPLAAAALLIYLALVAGAIFTIPAFVISGVWPRFFTAGNYVTSSLIMFAGGVLGIMFVALIGSLLTAVPLTPAGLGAVEGGVGAVLVKVFGVATGQATAILLVDRTISVFSIVVLGSIAYVISSKPRGGGIEVEEIGRAGFPEG